VKRPKQGQSGLRKRILKRSSSRTIWCDMSGIFGIVAFLCYCPFFDVSAQHIGPVFKVKIVHLVWTCYRLKMGEIGTPETAVTNLRCATNQKS